MIIYWGEDNEFYDFMNATIAKWYNHIEIEFIPDDYNKLLGNIFEKDVEILFLDFTTKNRSDFKAILYDISIFKKAKFFRSTIFVAVFADTENRNKLNLCYINGINFTFIKGDELNLLLVNILNHTYQANLNLPRLAKANKSKFDLQMGVVSKINSINKVELSIDTDIIFSNELDFDIDFSLVEDLDSKEFKALELNEASYSENFTSSVVLEIPYESSSDWETEVAEAGITEDMMDTWLDNNKDDLIKEVCTIVFSSNYRLLEEILSSKLVNKGIDLQFIDEIEGRDIDSMIVTKNPQIIFYDMNEANEFDHQGLKLITNTLNKLAQYPIICIYNSKSTSQAISKLLNYGFIVATKKTLDQKQFSDIVASYLEKKYTSLGEEFLKLSRFSSFSSVNFLENVEIQSMTECEIEFESKFQLPAYAIVYFELPVKMYLTLTTSFDDHSLGNDRFKYFGYINGITEEDRNHLRKLINQFIFKPPTEITIELIDSYIQHKETSEDKKDRSKNNEVVVEKNGNRDQKVDQIAHQNLKPIKKDWKKSKI